MLLEVRLRGAPMQLLQACIAGNRVRQLELYETYAPMAYALCLRYADDRAQAKDMLQEGFVRVFNNLDQFEGKGSFEGWIKRVFVNTAIEYYRKFHKKHQYLELADSIEAYTHPEVMDRLHLQDLMRMVRALPAGYRTVFNLFVIEGFSHSEIAQLLDISEGTSKSQLSKARKLLQNQIKKTA